MDIIGFLSNHVTEIALVWLTVCQFGYERALKKVTSQHQVMVAYVNDLRRIVKETATGKDPVDVSLTCNTNDL